MKILRFPSWLVRDNSVTAAPPPPFEPSTSIVRMYCDDIDRHGQPMDSGFSAYFRKMADYYENTEEQNND